MSISLEYALENKNQPAVLCCRAEAGLVLSEHNLEDPAIFDDLVDSGLLNLAGAITIGEALGAKLLGTFDSLLHQRQRPRSRLGKLALRGQCRVRFGYARRRREAPRQG